MRYDLKLIFDAEDDSKLNKVIVDRIFEIRYNQPDKVYDARYKNKELVDLPNFFKSEGIQNVIKNLWKN